MTASGKNEYYFQGTEDGAAELYYDNVKMLETYSNGVKLPQGSNSHLWLTDGGKAYFGTGTDLSLWHDGSHSHIQHENTGNLYVLCKNGQINFETASETMAQMIPNGQVKLYYDNTFRFATTSQGIEVNGTVSKFQSSGEVGVYIGSTNAGGAAIYFDGDSNGDWSGSDYSWIKHDTGGDMVIAGDNPNNDANVVLRVANGSENAVICNANAGVELYYNNTKHFETSSGGCKVNDNLYFGCGNGNDLTILHDGSHSHIKNTTNYLYYRSTQHQFKNADDNEVQAIFVENGDCELYYDNSKKFETNSTGSEVFGRFSVGSTGQLVNESGITATSGGNTCCFRATGAAGHSPIMTWNNHTSGNRSQIQFADGSSYSARGSITTNGSNVTYGGTSDYRLKQDDVLITDGITKVKALKPKRFKWKDNLSIGICDGFFAHEVQETAPTSGATIGTKDEVDSDGNPVYQSVDQAKLVPLLTAALKEAITKIETLETKVAALEAG